MLADLEKHVESFVAENEWLKTNKKKWAAKNWKDKTPKRSSRKVTMFKYWFYRKKKSVTESAITNWGHCQWPNECIRPKEEQGANGKWLRQLQKRKSPSQQ